MSRYITFHPFFRNIIDNLDRQFVTADGKVVVVSRPHIDFVVSIDGKTVMKSDDNNAVSAYLTQLDLIVRV